MGDTGSKKGTHHTAILGGSMMILTGIAICTWWILDITKQHEHIRDDIRMHDIQAIQQALDAWHGIHGIYPEGTQVQIGHEAAQALCENGWSRYLCSSEALGILSPAPKAPEPPDGICTETWNTYTYTQTEEGYEITFCLSSPVHTGTSGEQHVYQKTK